jgi:predicted lipoprotein with Yx(FWY)xxD motif
MVRPRVALAGVLTAALLASAGLMASSATAATIELRKTAKGDLITDSNGFTLFEFSINKKNENRCTTIARCPEVWPALLVTGTPTVGPGLTPKKVGTIMLPGGARQVTYGHRALYEYVGDTKPGETFYVGAFAFGGYWYGLDAKGKPVL